MSIELHELVHPYSYFTPDTERRYLELNFAYWAAISFMLCEYIATSSFEFTRIWSINYVAIKISLTRLPISPKMCSGWFTFQAVGFYLLYQPFSAILMLRVYAMYNRQKPVGAFLVSLWLTEACLSVVATILVFWGLEYDGVCYGTIAPRALWLMGGVGMFTNTVIFLMITAKRKAGRNAVDFLIAKKVFRDGLWMFALAAAICSSLIPYQFAKQDLRPHVALAWPSCLISFTTCRLIMNMQKIKVDNVEEDPSMKYVGRSLASIELPPFLSDGNQTCIDA